MNLMTPTTAHRATIDDLMRFDGKAELIAGRIVPIMPTGFRPGLIGKRIVRSLDDYFEAGTRVVWDVDPEAECVHKFVREMPDRPIAFRRGEIADAEPAVPGWRLSIDSIFA